MAERFFNFNHGCDKTQFSAEELVIMHVGLNDCIKLHCSCPECKRTHILDISEDGDSGFRKTLRRMFVRQQIVTIPDEIFDTKRFENYALDDLLDYSIDFNLSLMASPDKLISHKDLQNDYEEIAILGRHAKQNR